MLPVLILVGIPSATAACYLSWCQGRNVAMRLSDGNNRLEAPTQSILSYTSGLVALGGSYALQAQAIRRLEGGHQDATMPKTSATTTTTTTTGSPKGGAYKPPSGIGDVMGRMGKPALLHIGAASFAFFCMGLAQNYVACARDPISTTKKNLTTTTSKKERR